MEEIKIREEGVQAVKTKSTAESNHATVYLKFTAKLI